MKNEKIITFKINFIDYLYKVILKMALIISISICLDKYYIPYNTASDRFIYGMIIFFIIDLFMFSYSYFSPLKTDIIFRFMKRNNIKQLNINISEIDIDSFHGTKQNEYKTVSIDPDNSEAIK